MIAGTSQFCLIFPGPEKNITQAGSSGHAAGVPFLLVVTLWILTKGTLHGSFFFKTHLLHPAPNGFDGSKGTAQNICTARAYAEGCYTCISRLQQGFIPGFNSINGAKLWRNNISQFIIVMSFVANAIAGQTGMGMGFYKAWIYLRSCRIVYFCTIPEHVRLNFHDFFVIHQNISDKRIPVDRIMNKSVFNQQHSHSYLPFLIN